MTPLMTPLCRLSLGHKISYDSDSDSVASENQPLSRLSKFDTIKKNFTVPLLNYKPLKLWLRVLLAGHTVAIETYSVTKMATTCSPMTWRFFDTMIVAVSDEW